MGIEFWMLIGDRPFDGHANRSSRTEKSVETVYNNRIPKTIYCWKVS